MFIDARYESLDMQTKLTGSDTYGASYGDRLSNNFACHNIQRHMRCSFNQYGIKNGTLFSCRTKMGEGKKTPNRVDKKKEEKIVIYINLMVSKILKLTRAHPILVLLVLLLRLILLYLWIRCVQEHDACKDTQFFFCVGWLSHLHRRRHQAQPCFSCCCRSKTPTKKLYQWIKENREGEREKEAKYAKHTTNYY